MAFSIRRLAALLIAALMFVTASGALALSASAEATLGYRRSYSGKYVTLYVDKLDSADTVRYTTNGTAPNTSSKKYTDKGITVSKKTVVKLAEYNKSGKRVASLTVTLMPRAPMAEVTVVTSGGKQYLKLKSSVSGAKIYYTTDGSEPTQDSTRYKKKFLYTPGTTVKIRVYAKNYADGFIREYSVAAQSSLDNVSDEAKEVFAIVNEERAAAGRAAYTLDPELCAAADIRAKELATLYSHTRPDGTKGIEIMDELGISHTARSENIAKKQTTPEAVMIAWMASASHKEAILSTSYDYIGIGHYVEDGVHYWVQLFLRK